MTERRDNNGNKFDSTKWRSPLSGYTSEEVLKLRRETRRMHADVNRQLREEGLL